MADPAPGLPDAAVRELIGELDRLLGYLEQAGGPAAESAVAAVSALTQVYGTALARVRALAGADPQLLAALTGDEVLGNLLVLHGLHPDPPEARARRALAGIQPYLHSHGGDAELVSVAGGVARIRLTGSCQGCAAPAATLRQAVTDAVLSAAPELSGVEPAGGPPAPELIPAESLLRRPAAAGTAGDRVSAGPGTAGRVGTGPS